MTNLKLSTKLSNKKLRYTVYIMIKKKYPHFKFVYPTKFNGDKSSQKAQLCKIYLKNETRNSITKNRRNTNYRRRHLMNENDNKKAEINYDQH